MIQRWRMICPTEDEHGGWVYYTDHEDVVKGLVEALEDLMAQQNGPPLSLPRHAERWQKAMDEAQSALAKAKEVS